MALSERTAAAIRCIFIGAGNSLHIYWQVGNSLHIYWQVDNSACVGCFIFWVPNTSVDSITYGGVRLTVRIPEPSLTGMSDAAPRTKEVYDGSEPSQTA